MMRLVFLSAAVLAGTTLGPVAVQAQSSTRVPIEGRVDRLEGEMRAVQRKVFPGGSGQFVQPENQPTVPEAAPAGSPTSPLAELTTRVDSLETQLRAMTGQIEANQFKLQGLEGRIKTLEAAAAAAAAPPAPVEPGTIAPAAPANGAAVKPPVAAPGIDKPSTSNATAAPSTPADPTRKTRLAAVERPDTGDVAEDTYLYGYRLWSAKLYPEAEAQFTTVTTKFATHKRASYAQNLLGRSYLEEGKPSLASLAFYDNYKKWPDGDRAPESLYYLAQALVTLDKPAAQVCKVYSELTRSYGAKVDADPKMKAGVAKGRAAAKCS